MISAEIWDFIADRWVAEEGGVVFGTPDEYLKVRPPCFVMPCLRKPCWL